MKKYEFKAFPLSTKLSVKAEIISLWNSEATRQTRYLRDITTSEVPGIHQGQGESQRGQRSVNTDHYVCTHQIPSKQPDSWGEASYLHKQKGLFHVAQRETFGKKREHWVEAKQILLTFYIQIQRWREKVPRLPIKLRPELQQRGTEKSLGYQKGIQWTSGLQTDS